MSVVTYFIQAACFYRSAKQHAIRRGVPLKDLQNLACQLLIMRDAIWQFLSHFTANNAPHIAARRRRFTDTPREAHGLSDKHAARRGPTSRDYECLSF
jgi:hypothetical protein